MNQIEEIRRHEKLFTGPGASGFPYKLKRTESDLNHEGVHHLASFQGSLEKLLIKRPQWFGSQIIIIITIDVHSRSVFCKKPSVLCGGTLIRHTSCPLESWLTRSLHLGQGLPCVPFIHRYCPYRLFCLDHPYQYGLGDPLSATYWDEFYHIFLHDISCPPFPYKIQTIRLRILLSSTAKSSPFCC